MKAKRSLSFTSSSEASFPFLSSSHFFAAIKQPLYTKGFANVPEDAPGLGIELNDEETKKHLHKEYESYFEPTPQWNEVRSYDRIWS